MKEEDLWNKILLVVGIGDKVRFKYGKVTWEVINVGQVDGAHWIKLKRYQRTKLYYSGFYYGGSLLKGFSYYGGSLLKDVFQGTLEYSRLRIVEPYNKS